MRPLLALLAAASLALAPAASAKELTKAEACGASGCAALERDARGDGLIALRGPAGPLAEPPRPAAYYTLRSTFGGRAGEVPMTLTTLYVPSVKLVAAPGMTAGSLEWFSVSGAVLDKVRDPVRDLQPFAAPAAWPPALAMPIRPSPIISPSSGRDWMPWSAAGVAGLMALAGAASLLRRRHARRLRPAEFA